MNKRKKLLLILFIIAFVVSFSVITVYAEGFVDEVVSSANEYSKYPLSNYQLDFYVDKSWDWLPWNWVDGIGKTVTYAGYFLTNLIWQLLLFLSNITGFVVEQAFKLDFISTTASVIGKNIQLLTGVSANGFTGTGFFVGSLLLLVFSLAVYIIYTGLFKRQTSKVFSAITNFVVIGILSTSFFAFAPTYITNVNAFSNDLANSALSVGKSIILPNATSVSGDNVSLIRDSLHSLQVRKPWLLLQYGTTDEANIGNDRINDLLGKNPNENHGKDRQEVVKKEIENRQNGNLTTTGVIDRFGKVLVLLIFNLLISFFVLALSGMMIFTQILFILFSIFLPLSFIISLIPSQQGVAKRALIKLFNMIIHRAGICLIVSVTFCVSSMLYSLTNTFPFVFVMFVQLLLFAGVYIKTNDILRTFAFADNSSMQYAGQIRRGYSKLHHVMGYLSMKKLFSHNKAAQATKNNDSGPQAYKRRKNSVRDNVNNAYSQESKYNDKNKFLGESSSSSSQKRNNVNNQQNKDKNSSNMDMKNNVVSKPQQAIPKPQLQVKPQAQATIQKPKSQRDNVVSKQQTAPKPQAKPQAQATIQKLKPQTKPKINKGQRDNVVSKPQQATPKPQAKLQTQVITQKLKANRQNISVKNRPAVNSMKIQRQRGNVSYVTGNRQISVRDNVNKNRRNINNTQNFKRNTVRSNIKKSSVKSKRK